MLPQSKSKQAHSSQHSDEAKSNNTECNVDSNSRNGLYYFHQLPQGIQKSLSTEQTREIKKVIDRAIRIPSRKIVSLELTFWFWKRFYTVFYLGEDKRKLLRVSDPINGKLTKLTLHSLTTLIIWVATLFVIVTVIYYAKSTLNIDLFPNQHADEVILETIKNSID